MEKNLQFLLSLKRKGVQKSEYNMLLAYYIFLKEGKQNHIYMHLLIFI